MKKFIQQFGLVLLSEHIEMKHELDRTKYQKNWRQRELEELRARSSEMEDCLDKFTKEDGLATAELQRLRDKIDKQARHIDRLQEAKDLLENQVRRLKADMWGTL